MHIVFLTPGFAGNEEDTTCFTYFQNYLKALKDTSKDIKIQIVAFQYPYKKMEFDWHGVKVHLMGGANKKFPASGLIWAKVMQKVRTINQVKKIDIIHSLWLRECALVGNWITRFLNVPHVSTIMGTELSIPNKFLRLIDYRLMNLVCVSPMIQQRLKDFYQQGSATVIPWGIAENTIETENIERKIDLLGVGFLSEIKNFKQFIEVCHQLKKSYPKLKAVIIGGGVEEEGLREMIQKYNLQNTIKLTGLLVNDEVQHYMNRSKILLHTSTYESQGYVFLEALSQGMSIVSRSVGIARPSERWKIVETTKEFVHQTTQLLHHQTDFSKQYLLPIDKTVTDYCKLYKSIQR